QARGACQSSYRSRTSVETDPAKSFCFDERDGGAQLLGAHGGTETRRPSADDDDIHVYSCEWLAPALIVLNCSRCRTDAPGAKITLKGPPPRIRRLGCRGDGAFDMPGAPQDGDVRLERRLRLSASFADVETMPSACSRDMSRPERARLRRDGYTLFTTADT